MLTRLWEGKREFTDSTYWVGQVLIEDGGRNHSMWLDVSCNYHPSKDLATAELELFIECSNTERGCEMVTNATQQNFSPMRGHVVDGNTVLCDDGDVLTISSTIHGWMLMNKKGEQVGEPTHDASRVTLYVIGYGQ